MSLLVTPLSIRDSPSTEVETEAQLMSVDSSFNDVSYLKTRFRVAVGIRLSVNRESCDS
jgi:hypothetical protein